jgi:hypothetical protein
MSKKVRLFMKFALSVISFLCFSCFVYSTKVHQLVPYNLTKNISSPTKAHLTDGSLIIFQDGFSIAEDRLNGTGELYNLKRDKVKSVDSIQLDSVAFLEYYKSEVEGGSVLGGFLGPIIFGAGVSNDRIAKALFGSCPTIYSYDGDNYSLQAECFSYSVNPMSEDSDLDRIDHGCSFDNIYRLKITNEALETHYINYMQLIYVDHRPDYEAFPTDDHDIIFFAGENLVEHVHDRMGKDISDLVGMRDTNWFQSDSSALDQLTEKIVDDWIDINVKKTRDTNQIILALRLRNTLLNTVLFYDVMLGSAGIQSLNWMAGEGLDLQYALNFQSWYRKHFGLKVQVWNGQEFELVERIGDCGPIAWRQLAINLDVPKNEDVKIRLSFLPDNWMIDWVGASLPVSDNPEVRKSNCQSLTKMSMDKIDIDPAPLTEADDNYLVTYPTDVYHADYQVADQKSELHRTYFLKSEGFYIEWIRRDWFASATFDKSNKELYLDDETVIRAARIWQSKKHSFEKDFFSSKISNQRGN